MKSSFFYRYDNILFKTRRNARGEHVFHSCTPYFYIATSKEIGLSLWSTVWLKNDWE